MRRHADLSCSSSLENRKPQANDGNIREFCSGGGGSLFLLLLFLLLPSGAFSPAYKREYTAVPLRPGAELCMYATCIHGSLARSRQDKRDPYILAWLGIDWPESGAERRRAGVGGTARLVVVRIRRERRVIGPWRTQIGWLAERRYTAEPSPRGHASIYTQRTAVLGSLFCLSSPISLLSRWSLSSLRPLHRGRGFILSFTSRFPNPTYFVSRSLARLLESRLSAA